MTKFKKIMATELGNYQVQIQKMKKRDRAAITKVKEKK